MIVVQVLLEWREDGSLWCRERGIVGTVWSDGKATVDDEADGEGYHREVAPRDASVEVKRRAIEDEVIAAIGGTVTARLDARRAQ